MLKLFFVYKNLIYRRSLIDIVLVSGVQAVQEVTQPLRTKKRMFYLTL